MSQALAVAGRSRQPLVEYVPCAFLGLLGVLLLIDASTLSNNRTGVDPLGPRPAPILVGVISLVLALALALAISRGDRAEAESGEDIDLDSRMDLKTVLLLMAVFLANIVLIDTLGSCGANLGVTSGPAAVDAAIEPLEYRGVIVVENGRLRVRDRNLLRYYARSLDHLLESPSRRTH